MMLAPWVSGRLLVWDATCPDTFAPSYCAHATLHPGKVTEQAEDRKEEKYRGLPASYLFAPVAIETLGAVGPHSLALLKDIGRRIAAESGEGRLGEYLMQCLSHQCWGAWARDCNLFHFISLSFHHFNSYLDVK